MDWLTFDYNHSLEIDEADEKAAAASEALGTTYGLEVTRTKRRIDVVGKVLRGRLEVHKKKVSVHLALVGQVTPTRASVKAGIRKVLDQQFK